MYNYILYNITNLTLLNSSLSGTSIFKTPETKTLIFIELDGAYK